MWVGRNESVERTVASFLQIEAALVDRNFGFESLRTAPQNDFVGIMWLGRGSVIDNDPHSPTPIKVTLAQLPNLKAALAALFQTIGNAIDHHIGNSELG